MIFQVNTINIECWKTQMRESDNYSQSNAKKNDTLEPFIKRWNMTDHSASVPCDTAEKELVRVLSRGPNKLLAFSKPQLDSESSRGSVHGCKCLERGSDAIILRIPTVYLLLFKGPHSPISLCLDHQCGIQ